MESQDERAAAEEELETTVAEQRQTEASAGPGLLEDAPESEAPPDAGGASGSESDDTAVGPKRATQSEARSSFSYGGRLDCGRSGEVQDDYADGAERSVRYGHDARHNIDLGKRGEDAACAFLLRHGFDILERNWTCIAGEADIIAIDESALHFIEVKTRMSEARGFPAEAVDAKKRQRYERIAELFLRSFEERFDTRVTFDIISILVTGRNRAFLRMHRDVFANDCA